MRAKAIILVFILASAIVAGATTYQTLHHFDSFYDGNSPFAGVIFDQSGNLYGVTPWGETHEGTIFRLVPSQGGWTYGRLWEFELRPPGDPGDYYGAEPIGGLVMDEAGNFYGTTSWDYTRDGGCGSVFKLSPSRELTYFRFFPYTGTEGCDPETALTYSGGRLWGTTVGGGSSGQGTVFSMDTTGDNFQSQSFTGNNGNQPLSALSLWGYGTTYSGGENGKGNIYKLDAAKGLVNKYSFTVDGEAGYAPVGDLLTLSVGGVRTIYGTTSAGGAGGGGTVYRLTETKPNSDRWRLRVLHSFSSSGGAGGWRPLAGLTADAGGNLYGTTAKGGLNGTTVPDGSHRSDCGTVFKLSPRQNNKWTFAVLHSFDSNLEEGCYPTAGVVLDSVGNLYGTTTEGGWWTYGTVYGIIP